MSNNTAVTQTTNIVPVQGVFAPEPSFALQYFVGPAGTPFYGPENSSFTNISFFFYSKINTQHYRLFEI
jgi:hypothetical protein